MVLGFRASLRSSWSHARIYVSKIQIFIGNRITFLIISYLFQGDLNQMFNHPGIDPSRKLMNKKLYDLCGQGLLDGSRNLNSSMALVTSSDETSSDEESDDSSKVNTLKNTASLNKTSPGCRNVISCK